MIYLTVQMKDKIQWKIHIDGISQISLILIWYDSQPCYSSFLCTLYCGNWRFLSLAILSPMNRWSN